MKIQIVKRIEDLYDTPIDELVEMLQKEAEGLDECTLQYDTNGDDATFRIVGTRPATDEEVLEKLAEDARRDEVAKVHIRAQMERWKRDYPDAWNEVVHG